MWGSFCRSCHRREGFREREILDEKKVLFGNGIFAGVGSFGNWDGADGTRGFWNVYGGGTGLTGLSEGI